MKKRKKAKINEHETEKIEDRLEKKMMDQVAEQMGGYEPIMMSQCSSTIEVIETFKKHQSNINTLHGEVESLKVKTKNLGLSGNGKNHQLDTIRADVCSLQAQVERLKTESFKGVHWRLNVIEATIPPEVRDSVKRRLMKEQNSNYGV